MSYAIIRNAKYKAANLQSISRHNERQNSRYGNKEIDTEKSHLNYHLKTPMESSYDKEFDRIRKEQNLKGNLRLTGKKQSNVACEFIITSDSKFFGELSAEESRRFFEESYKFACAKCGEENIISAVVHNDESTPHMHLTYIPVVEGKKKDKPIKKINCSEFWKGFNSYGKLQDEYYQFITERGFKLDRGEIREDKVKHLTVEEYKLKTEMDKVQDKYKNVKGTLASLSKTEDNVKELLDKLSKVNTTKGLMSDKLKISQEDYDILVKVAKAGESRLLENAQLKAKVKKLEDALSQKSFDDKLNSSTKTAYDKLQHDNSRLKRDFDVVEKAIKNLNLQDKINDEIKEIIKSKQISKSR